MAYSPLIFSGVFMFETDHTVQRQLFAFTHRDLVAEGSDVWLYVDLFDNANLEEFDFSYKSQGQAAKEPKLMLRTLFYALTHGICSGRKLTEVCRHDNRFIVLSGDTRPDRRTFDRFIRRHEEAIDRFFIDVVRMAQVMGLASLGRVAIDGTKLQVSPGKHMRYDKMGRAMGYIREELEELKTSLQDANAKEATPDKNELEEQISTREKRLALIQRAKEQIDEEFKRSKLKASKKDQRKPKATKALHDPEALSLGASAKFPYGYNAQAAVDSDSQIIVAADLSDSANDSRSLPGLLDEMNETCGGSARKVLADSGYNSYENLRAVKEHGSTPYIAGGREYAEAKLKPLEQVRKKAEAFTCLSGRSLTVKSQNATRVVFSLSSQFCKGCTFKDTCQLFGKKSCEIPSGDKGRYLKQYYRRRRTPGFKDTYRYRKAIVEPVFGNIKNKGLKLFHRGRRKTYIFWRMACTAHNIEKMVKAASRRRRSPQLALGV